MIRRRTALIITASLCCLLWMQPTLALDAKENVAKMASMASTVQAAQKKAQAAAQKAARERAAAAKAKAAMEKAKKLPKKL